MGEREAPVGNPCRRHSGNRDFIDVSLHTTEMIMKNMCYICAVLILSCAGSFAQSVSAGSLDVRSLGARGDGSTLDTKSIQSAIDSCAAISGTVIFPPGTYLSGSLELKNNVTLHLEKGAVLLGSTNLSDYVERIPKLKSYNDVFLKYSLLYAEGQSHIAITGEGTIDGQGGSFKVLTNEKPAKYYNRPFVVRFVECEHVTIDGVTLQNSAMWMQQYLACRDVLIHGVTIFNHANKNNDMMDIDGCKNVVISDCRGDTDDDGITLKSTSDRVTENVTISGCLVSSHCNAIKTGTESTGGFKNVVIDNVIVKPSSMKTTMSGKPEGISGIALTLVDGGTMDGISISNIVMDGPEVPIFIRLGNRARKHWAGAPQPGIGKIRNVQLSNIVARNVKSTGCSITGLPQYPVEGITLSNIRLEFSGGGQASAHLSIPEMEDQYPEATMWGMLPAYGFTLHHVKDINFRGLDMTCTTEDTRPAMLLSDVSGARLTEFNGSVSPKADAAIVLDNTNEFLMFGSFIKTNIPYLLKLTGDRNSGVSIIGNDLRNVGSVCTSETKKLVFEASNRINDRPGTKQ